MILWCHHPAAGTDEAPASLISRTPLLTAALSAVRGSVNFFQELFFLRERCALSSAQHKPEAHKTTSFIHFSFFKQIH